MKPQMRMEKYRQSIQMLFLLVFSSIFVMGCSEITPTSSLSEVLAKWDDEQDTLQVSGTVLSDNEYIEIKDAASGELLGAAVVNSDGSFKVSSSAASCEILIELQGESASYGVNNAPESCVSSRDVVRAAVMSIPDEVVFTDNPSIDNAVPNAIILSPPSDITISVGQSVNFAGTATGFSVTPPVSYYWNLGGAAPNTTVQNPGPVIFNRPGTYFVQLSVSDNLGIPDPTPATRTIIVTGGNTPISNTPTPVIASPVTVGDSISINVGESLFFSGSATDANGSTTFFFEWDFSGAAANQYGPTPGNVTFNNAGTYIVSLYATNVLGVRSAIPDQITVNVGIGGGGFNQPPNGYITSPAQNVTINPGDTLSFIGNGSDPEGDPNLYYSWDFNGQAQNIYMSTSRSGGNVTFSTPGIFYITMTVTDSAGDADPTPAVRTITVQNTGGGGVNPLVGQIISPPTDVTISPGQSVFFSGQAATTLPGQVRYFWTFDGAAPNSNLQTPGDITFPLAGVYTVQLVIADNLGNVIGGPASRTITVTGSGTGVGQLAATILSPSDNSNIQVGESVFLSAQAPAVFGLTNIQYRWRIRQQGSTTDLFTSNQLSPGNFVFDRPGSYRIRFRVSGIEPISGNRVAEVARVTVNVTDPIIAATPIIALPQQDMVVTVGQTVYFQAGSVAGTNLTYRWTFNGLAPDSFQSIPPPVMASQPGNYIVRLRVTGTSFTGAPINLEEQRVISVIFNGNPSPIPGPFPPIPQPPVGGAATPEGIIDLPAGNQTVRVGTAVQFSGRAFDPLGGGQLTFLWSFGGAAPNISSQFPGTLTFNRVGNYVVTLLVVNAFGQIDPTPATVVITVVP